MYCVLCVSYWVLVCVAFLNLLRNFIFYVPQNPKYFPPIYVPRLPAMIIQSIIIIFLRRALDWYSRAFFVSFVALVVYSTALSTCVSEIYLESELMIFWWANDFWFFDDYFFHVYLMTYSEFDYIWKNPREYWLNISKQYTLFFLEIYIPILFTISPWLSINCLCNLF